MESGEFGSAGKGRWAYKLMRALKWVAAIIGTIWFLVCQVCLLYVLLKTSNIPDLCCASQRSESWALVISIFGWSGGLTFGVIPVALLFLGVTLATHRKKEYIEIATTSKEIFLIAAAFLVASFIALFGICAPSNIPIPARVMLSGIGDIVLAMALIYILRKR